MSAAGFSVQNGLPNYIVVGGSVMAKWLDELRYEAVILKIDDAARTACVTWSGWSNSWDSEVPFDDIGPFDDEMGEICYLERLEIEVDNMEEERFTKEDPSFKTTSLAPLDGQSPKVTRQYKKLMLSSSVDLLDALGSGVMFHISCLDRNANLNPRASSEISGLIRVNCDMVPELGINLRRQLAVLTFDLDDCEKEGAERLCLLARAYNEAVCEFLQSATDARLAQIKNTDITPEGAWFAAMTSIIRFLPVATRDEPPLTHMCGIHISQLQILIDALRPTEDDVFVHLGSGAGEVVFFLAAACKVGHVIGLEMSRTSAIAQKAHDHYLKVMNYFGKVASPVSVAQGNFLDAHYVEFFTEQANVVFIDNRAMSHALNELIKEIILSKMPHGSRIISTDVLEDNNTDIEINKENYRGLAVILQTKQLDDAQGAPRDGPKLYLHNINRDNLTQFLNANPELTLTKTPKRVSLDLPRVPEQHNVPKRSHEI